MQVIDPGGVVVRIDSHVADHRNDVTMRWSNPRARMPATILSAARTNPGGHCIVHGVPGDGNLMIRVSIGRRHLYLERNVEFGEDHRSRKIEVDN